MISVITSCMLASRAGSARGCAHIAAGSASEVRWLTLTRGQRRESRRAGCTANAAVEVQREVASAVQLSDCRLQGTQAHDMSATSCHKGVRRKAGAAPYLG